MKMDLKDSRLQESMRSLGVSEKDMNIQNAISVSLVQQALHGNIKAFQVVCDMLQQNPKYGEDKEHIEGVTFVFDIPTSKKELDKKE